MHVADDVALVRPLLVVIVIGGIAFAAVQWRSAGSVATERCLLERLAANTPGSFFEASKATLSGR